METRRLKETYREWLGRGKLLAAGTAVVLPFLLILAAALTIALDPPIGPLLGVMCLAALGAYLALVGWLGSFETRIIAADQHLRDIAANEIHRKLAAGESTPPFSLYLRPFISTNDFRLPKSVTEVGVLVSRGSGENARTVMVSKEEASPGFISVTVGTTPRQTELEGVLMAAVARHAPLVCLGSRLEHSGAGRIEVTDEDWQASVQRLIRAAELIVVAPSKRAGTLWEIEVILDSGLIDRCVFIDLPSPKNSGGKFDQEKEWLAIREAFAKRGYDLPENDEAGHFLYFGRQKSPLLGTPIGYLEPNRMAEFFEAVLKAKGALAQPGETVTRPT